MINNIKFGHSGFSCKLLLASLWIVWGSSTDVSCTRCPSALKKLLSNCLGALADPLPGQISDKGPSKLLSRADPVDRVVGQLVEEPIVDFRWDFISNLCYLSCILLPSNMESKRWAEEESVPFYMLMNLGEKNPAFSLSCKSKSI